VWPDDCPLPPYRPHERSSYPAVEESMETRDGHQKGAQQHAEGQHGEKAHARFLEQIHQPMHRDDEKAPENGGESESDGDDRQRR
jgi:hypothetical protein